MLDFLQQIDSSLFYFLNVRMANPVFDLVMPFLTEKYTWFPVWSIAAVFLITRGGKNGRWALLIAIIAVGMSDYISASIIKPLAGRIRPCNVEPVVHLLGKKKSSFSFPSAHAANFFALATVFSYFYYNYRVIFWFFAVLVAYSRIAVGVHYPFDVTAGALLGYVMAVVLLLSYEHFLSAGKPKDKEMK